MLLKATAALLAVIGSAVAVPTPEAQATSATTKYCDAATTICYAEYTTTANVVIRIAIPDTAKAGAFDVLLQIVAPKAAGWAGIAWGGSMAYNPLTVAWPNSSSAVASSRWATSHNLPAAYSGASYTVLPTSTTNSTHWKLDALAKGVSSWTDASGKTVALDPSSSAATLAWAMSTRAVTTPASNTSSFPGHTSKGSLSADFGSAKIANFTTLVSKLQSTTA